MIAIDGSDGGGQILRSSLTLSLLTGEAFRITQIRGQREQPGLKRQHLTCVQAALEIGKGAADGAVLGSRELVFHPGKVAAGDYHIRMSTAGSTTLVLQTLLLPLLQAEAESTVVIEGGTHNPMAPPVDYVQDVFLPVLRRMGADVALTLERYGFAPAGGGRIRARIRPSALTPIHLIARGRCLEERARVLAAHLDEGVIKRQRRALAKGLDWAEKALQTEVITESDGPGNVLMIGGVWEQGSEWVSTFGKRGRTSESVVREAVKGWRRYVQSGAPVGRRLGDQLLLPASLAPGSRFRMESSSNHFETNRRVIESFLPVKMVTREEESGVVDVKVTT